MSNVIAKYCDLCVQKVGVNADTAHIIDSDGTSRRVHVWCAIDNGYKILGVKQDMEKQAYSDGVIDMGMIEPEAGLPKDNGCPVRARSIAEMATVVNIVELEHTVYALLRSDGGVESERSAAATILYVPLMTGQIGRVRIDTLSDKALQEWKAAHSQNT